MASMPRRSIWGSTRIRRSCALLFAETVFLSGAALPSISSTSSSRAVTFIIPARSVSILSEEISVTVAFMPMDLICTVSPTFTGRADFLSSTGSGAGRRASADRFRRRRSSLRASLMRWASSSSFACFFISSSWAKVSSAVALASAMIRSASRRDF